MFSNLFRRLRPLAAPLGAAFGALTLAFASSATAQELNLYTYREPGLIKPRFIRLETSVRPATISSPLGPSMKPSAIFTGLQLIPHTFASGRVHRARILGKQ